MKSLRLATDGDRLTVAGMRIASPRKTRNTRKEELGWGKCSRRGDKALRVRYSGNAGAYATSKECFSSDGTPVPFDVFSLMVTFLTVIESFGDRVTEKIFLGEGLSRKEQQKLGDLDVIKAQQRLAVLHQASEQDLLRLPMLHYHRLQGTLR